MRILFIVSVAFSLCAHCTVKCFAQGFENRTYDDGQGNRMTYQLWLPPGHDQPGKEFPLIVWMHGAGGSSGSVPQGLINATRTERFAAYLVSPQGAPPSMGGGPWANCRNQNPRELTVDCLPGTTRSMQSVLEIVDELEAEFSVDSSRRFASGYSAGSAGVFDVLKKHPDVFSAAVAIQGGYDPDLITEKIDSRLWVMHGRDDVSLPSYWSHSSVQKIIELGGSAIYLEPPGGHGAPFMQTFFEDPDDELYPWLFEGVEPTLARLLYDPSNGNVKIDADSAPGGEISRMTLSARSDLLPAAITEINGDALGVDRTSIRYTASGPGFSGIVDMGNILAADMDFTELHEALAAFQYDSPAASSRNRTFRLMIVPPGDFDTNGALDGADIDQLVWEIAAGTHNSDFDLTDDDLVNADDLSHWVKDLRTTWFGDANVDGEFNSSDLTTVLAAGEFNDDIELNSGWATGDWDGDGDFTSADLVVALADGGFGKGERVAAAAVPEPASFVMVVAGLVGIAIRRRHVGQ